MPSMRKNKRRNPNESGVENQQAPQAPLNPLNDQIDHANFRATFTTLA